MPKQKNILIISQKVDRNDDLLGFFHNWIVEFAKVAGKVTVICLQKGEYDLPENVSVLSLGKEGGQSRSKYVWRFYKYIWQQRKNYDSVWVHMNKEYVLLGGLLWRMMGKRVVLWYAHYLINVSVRLAVAFSHAVVTSTRFACKLSSKKLSVVGQGVAVDYFKSRKEHVRGKKLLFLGRISPVKKLETLIDAMHLISDHDVTLDIVGKAAKGHEQYETDMRERAADSGAIRFVGAVSHGNTLAQYQSHDLFINLTRTGSFDKTTLEAMASGMLTIVCNRSYESIYPQYWHQQMIFEEDNAEDLASKIIAVLGWADTKKILIEDQSREIIVRDHGVTNMVRNIMEVL